MDCVGCGDNPAKRKDSFGTAMGMGFGGPQELLVNRVKAFQRMGNEQKELWGAYADTYLSGVRDPSRHDAATLEEFCTNHQVPELGAATPSFSGGMGAIMEPMDPEKDAIVQRIKAFQRGNPEA